VLVASTATGTARKFSDIKLTSTTVLPGAQATLGIDASLVATYNTASALDNSTAAKTAYKLMPAAAYTIPATASFTGTNTTSTGFDVTVNEALLEPGGKYMIPLVVNSVTGSVPINATRKHLYMLYDMPKVPLVEFIYPGQQQSKTDVVLNNLVSFEGLKLSTLAGLKNGTATFDVDATLVAQYNTDNGLDGSAGKEPYIILPVANRVIPTTTITFANTELSSNAFSIGVNTAGLTAGGKYILPIAIVSGQHDVNDVPEALPTNPERDYLYLLITIKK